MKIYCARNNEKILDKLIGKPLWIKCEGRSPLMFEYYYYLQVLGKQYNEVHDCIYYCCSTITENSGIQPSNSYWQPEHDIKVVQPYKILSLEEVLEIIHI